MKFRKKPIVIDAIQYLGGEESQDQICDFVCDSLEVSDDCLIISTLEGEMLVSPGDWVIQGVAGEHYPCKPDIFEFTYEKAE
ncbi:hypothetical protein UFOVP7_16 [uncultured Caudovirales phage]|uniref:Phage protein n=1 Tax=uncultured Caudovirales phage TaxID=2100421 RepID=A0A6J5KGD6_9CAUD|nr:hypothetical protein UFOVP7_16 [uncultured Caudovirales phage]